MGHKMSLNKCAQNPVKTADTFEIDKCYWQNKLGGETVLSTFPYTACSLGQNRSEYQSISKQVEKNIYERLASISKKSEPGTYMLLLSALTYLLYRYTGNDEILLGMPAFRDAEGLTSTNMLLLKTCIDEDISFKEFLMGIRNTVMEADEHSGFSYLEALRFPGFKTIDAMPPLINTIALMEQIHDDSILRHVNADMIFRFSMEEDLLTISLCYSKSLYDEQTPVQILNQLMNVLTAITENSGTLMSDITILSKEDKRKLIEEFNESKAQYPADKTIHGLFEEHAAQAPENIALTLENSVMTYGELNERSNKMARTLRNLGVSRDSITAVMAERSMDMIIAALAVLKAGGAYLPIDPTYPQDRIKYMLQDSGAVILLTQSNIARGYLSKEKNNTLSILDIDNESIYSNDGSDLENINLPDDLAYVIYTSGTTGKPKGAMIEHRNVVRLLFNDRFQFEFGSEDVWTMFHSFCFDFSVWEMYGALLYGGRLVIVPRHIAQDPGEYLKLLKEQQVTILNQTPTAFYNLIKEEMEADGKELAIRYVVFGGEALKPAMLKGWREKYPDTRLINMYGITETTVHVTFKEITEKEMESNISNIGKPIPTLSAYIVDSKMRLLPIGAAGEICVGGDGVGRGYLNRPELTAEKFVQDRFKNSGRLYRSGDLARLLHNGEMEYLGRIDHQVKIRGHRIELGEIETVLLGHEEVKEVVVLTREDADKNRYICAYYVSDTEITTAAFRSYLLEKLPNYMVPAYFIRLEKVPLTQNNKVDRKALPDPEKSIVSGEEYTAPRNEVERVLAGIWQEVLKLDKIGINESFFNMGGDSIKAITLISRMNRELQTSIQMKDLYLKHTIAGISEVISTSGSSLTDELKEGLKIIEDVRERILEDEGKKKCLPDTYEDFYPLSPIQQGMIFFANLMPDEPIYHDEFAYTVKIKRFNIDTYNNALALLTQRHPILRTTFDTDNFETLIQIVHKQDSGILPRISMENLDGLSRSFQERCVAEYMQKDLMNKFRFNGGLLWRMRVFKLDSENICICLAFQHAVLDGWSVAVLFTELMDIYSKLLSGEDYNIQPLKSSYKDYVAVSLERKASERVKEFWGELLKGYSRMKLPFNISNKRINNTNGSKKLKKAFDQELEKALEVKLKEYGCSMQELCISAYIYLLSIITTEKDVVAGVVTHERPAVEDAEKVLGCFLNTVPMRIRVDEQTNKREFVKTVQENFRNVRANELFLADIAGIIGENGNSNPIFDTLLNYTDFHIIESLENSGAAEQPDFVLDVDSKEMTNTLFDWEISRTLKNFVLQVKYSPNYFSDEDIETAAQIYTRILEQFAYSKEEFIDKEALLSDSQKNFLLYEFNNTVVPYPKEKTLYGLFEESAEKSPDNPALTFEDTSMTYGELNKKANQLARILIKNGVKSEDNIGLITQRGFETVIGMLAILKAGGAYVPIDPEYPTARKDYIIQNSHVTVVLSDMEYEVSAGKTVLIDYVEMELYAGENLSLYKSSSDLAYIIYTSGSTGLPKGVMIEHHSAVNLITWVNKTFNVNEKDSLLFITSMCFDLSVYDIFGTLAAGGRVVIAKKEQIQNPERLKKLMTEENITFWDSVPSTMNYLVNTLEENNEQFVQEQLRLVFMSGDWIPVKLPERLKRFFPNTRVISLGGATEGTVWSNYYPIEKVTEYQTSIPYGKPIDNNYFYILDDSLKPVPPGVAGELFIGGVGVARGYMNNEEKTKASFIKNRFLEGENEMMYRTGDLGRMLPDGNMEFLGRKDHQVKIRGYRVELGEIENQLLLSPFVKEAVAIDRVDTSGNKYLCAYIVWEQEENVPALKEYLSAQLPEYMLPAYFISIAAVPLTSNGKIDRKSLPAPAETVSKGMEYEAPGNETEKKLVEIWEEILAARNIGVNDNFFDVGGNSLLLVRMHSQINRLYPGRINITDIFRNQTIKKIAAFLEGNGDEIPKDMEINLLKLPEEYFNRGSFISTPEVYEFRIHGILHEKLKLITETENVRVRDVLLSLCAYLFAEISGSDDIPVQTVLEKENRAANLNLELGNVESINELLKLTAQKNLALKDSETYNIGAVDKLNLKKSNDSVLLLLYDRKLYTAQNELMEVCDISFSFVEDEESVQMYMECSGRVRKEKMEGVARSYISLLELLEDRY